MNSVNTKKLQHIELDMLKSVDEISKILGIRYFMIAGTMLGAKRHKGFIPWDDDIDIGMLRADYEIFIRSAPKYLPKYYFLQNYTTDKNFYLGFTKIRDSRTTFIEKSLSHHKINHGVFIDIFPIDYVDEKESIYTKLKRSFIITRIYSEFNFDRTNETILQKIKKILSKLLYPSASKAVACLEKIYSQVSNGKRMVNHYGAWGEREIMDATIFNELENYRFEDNFFPGVKNADEYLSNMYDNYMQLPPEDKRVSHHYTEIIDLDKPYNLYI